MEQDTKLEPGHYEMVDNKWIKVDPKDQRTLAEKVTGIKELGRDFTGKTGFGKPGPYGFKEKQA